VMLVVKRWLSDDKPAQVVCLTPTSRRRTFLLDSLQPSGNAKRRPITSIVKTNMESEVPKLLNQNFISPNAAAYLLQFARGRLVLPARPVSYNFLNYSWQNVSQTVRDVVVRYDGEEPMRGVRIRSVAGSMDPAEAPNEGADDAPVALNVDLS